MMVKKLLIPILILLIACDKKASEDPKKQFDSDIAAIESYLSQQGITAYKDPKGIYYNINIEGNESLPPKLEHTVQVQYTIRLMSDNSVVAIETKQGLLSSFIQGLQVGLSVMPKGTAATLYIPSTLAYGSAGSQKIPANANLIYEVEVLDVTRPASEIDQLDKDVTTIDKYLADSSINAVHDASGLRYVITDPGTGIMPTWYSKVRIRYTGRILSTGESFFSGTLGPKTNFDSRVVDYLQAFQIGLQKMHEGGKAIFYVPSGLGFGSKATSDAKIPANSNLLYEMELVEVID
jgi:FKBP-type peptidyl-prolyl cis-trans isomerase FkpA